MGRKNREIKGDTWLGTFHGKVVWVINQMFEEQCKISSVAAFKRGMLCFPYLRYTLSCLINVEGVINVNGEQKLHFNKRGGWNNRGGWGSGGKIINVEGGNL